MGQYGGAVEKRSNTMKWWLSAIGRILALGIWAEAAAGSGHAIAHDGSEIYFEVHGSGEKFLFLGLGTAVPRAVSTLPGQEPPLAAMEMSARAKQTYIDGLGSTYRLIFIEYPGIEPKMYTSSARARARATCQPTPAMVTSYSNSGSAKRSVLGYLYAARNGQHLPAELLRERHQGMTTLVPTRAPALSSYR